MKHILDAYGEAFDFPEFDAPRTSYMLACSPRTGSTLLALKLWATGSMGAPMEYLQLPHASGIVERISGAEPERYWDLLKRRRTSPNGVFGFKMFLSSYLNVTKHQPEIVSQVVSDFVIYLTRRDLLAQAISRAKAIQSGIWFHDADAPTRSIHYDFELIESCYEQARGQNGLWEELFVRTNAAPHRVYYEDLVGDSDAVVCRILKAHEIDANPASAPSLLALRRQSDQDNVEWVERFEGDCCKRGLPKPIRS